jgi:hypothetical protein
MRKALGAGEALLRALGQRAIEYARQLARNLGIMHPNVVRLYMHLLVEHGDGRGAGEGHVTS